MNYRGSLPFNHPLHNPGCHCLFVLSCGHATLLEALSVCWSICPSVSLSIHSSAQIVQKRACLGVAQHLYKSLCLLVGWSVVSVARSVTLEFMKSLENSQSSSFMLLVISLSYLVWSNRARDWSRNSRYLSFHALPYRSTDLQFGEKSLGQV